MAVVLFSMEPDQRAGLFLVPGDKAVIYFYRDESGDEAMPVALTIDGVPVGEPGADGLLYRDADPGTHTVTLSVADADSIVLTVEAGRVYFIGQHVECVASRTHLYLHPVNEAAGRARVRALIAARKSPLPQDAHMAPIAPHCGSTAKGIPGTAL